MDVSILMFALPLVAGVLLDKLLGDPLWLPHPVVGFGKLIAFFEHRLNHGTGRKFKVPVLPQAGYAHLAVCNPPVAVCLADKPRFIRFSGRYGRFLLSGG